MRYMSAQCPHNVRTMFVQHLTKDICLEAASEEGATSVVACVFRITALPLLQGLNYYLRPRFREAAKEPAAEYELAEGSAAGPPHQMDDE